ncbi:hypothetical protein C8N37_106364 [Sphingobacterium faecium]|nr:hypothetical protein C8N37_106364 [Sphingobacterium faecium]
MQFIVKISLLNHKIDHKKWAAYIVYTAQFV